MRELYIKNGQGFLLVYSVTDKKSLEELVAIREQIIRIKGTSNIPIVLIGNKCDLADERELEPEEGIAVSKQWNKVPFYETSAMYKMNVDDAFIDVVRQILRKEVEQQQKQQVQTHKINEPEQKNQQTPIQNVPVQQKQQSQMSRPVTGNTSGTATKGSVAKNSNTPPKKAKKSRKCVIL